MDVAGSASPQTALLRVSDTGYGMTADVKARMFAPYFSTREEGHGLAAMQGIVQPHGGSVNAETAVGQGTTVRIPFPLLADQHSGVDDQENSSDEVPQSAA